MPVSGGNNRGLGSADEERQRDGSRGGGEAMSRGVASRGAGASERGDEERAISPTRETGGGRTSAQADGQTRADSRRGGKSLRGFASMDPNRQREIASKGGRAAHAKGTAHEWSSDEARVAGRKGGEAVSRDRAHMAQIGREGGEARGKAARQQSPSNRGGGSNGSGERAERADQRNEGNRP